MALFNKMARAFERSLTNIGRSRAREHLLRQSDHVLADAGFSRERLEIGNAAWPWTTSDEASDRLIARSVRQAATASTTTDVLPFPAADETAADRSSDNVRQKAA